MSIKKTLVITSIANDKHPVLNKISADIPNHDFEFILIGDIKSPKEFKLANCDFWGVEKQLK
ncbi:MAG: DUF288 domain-containing protein, partial [Bacteroidetes bacterium]|nr:DUF288 domain-containing protein [Bacteroidota bacterium]